MSETERAREAGDQTAFLKECLSSANKRAEEFEALYNEMHDRYYALANRQQAPADATGGVEAAAERIKAKLCEIDQEARVDVFEVDEVGPAHVHIEGWIDPIELASAALASSPAAPAQAGSREEAVARAIRALVLATEDRSSGDTVEMNVGALTEIIGILATPPATRSEEEIRREVEASIQASIDSSPEPLRRLGEWLATVLDEDSWKTAERLLLGAAGSPQTSAGAR